MDVFSRIDVSGSAIEIWTSIHDIQKGSLDLKEEK
jgi:hypothetical protein